MTAAEQVGGLIYELREDRYLTQKALADMLGVSQSTISRWERGQFLPSYTALGRLGVEGPGFFEELRQLWIDGRWELYHKQPRPTRPRQGAEARE